ncbi:MAG: hypothetical protein FWG72_02740 [Oscillospiraceae bacterium]|nr:hypothetical protein [Oscillospiraceae bacterium]
MRGMVFMDHMNFDIALQEYYMSYGEPTPKLDYRKLFRNLTAEKTPILSRLLSLRRNRTNF